MEAIAVQWNCSNLDLARKVSRYLVQERLAASAEIIPWFESIELLDNQLETAQMSKVNLVTDAQLFNEIKKVIEKASTDEIPEIYAIAVSQATPQFLHWIEETIAIPFGN